MTEKSAYNMMITTCRSRQEGEGLARSLVESRMAACVQVMPITSFYEWNDRIDKDEEILLLIKTKAEIYGKVEAFILEHHTYEVPEIIEVPIKNGLGAYFRFIDEKCG